MSDVLAFRRVGRTWSGRYGTIKLSKTKEDSNGRDEQGLEKTVYSWDWYWPEDAFAEVHAHTSWHPRPQAIDNYGVCVAVYVTCEWCDSVSTASESLIPVPKWLYCVCVYVCCSFFFASDWTNSFCRAQCARLGDMKGHVTVDCVLVVQNFSFWTLFIRWICAKRPTVAGRQRKNRW